MKEETTTQKVVELQTEIAELQKKSETYGIEIEWNKLIGEDISALSSYKRNIDAKIEKLQRTLEKTRVEIADKLSDEYYKKILRGKLRDELERLKVKFISQKSLSEEEQNQVKAYAKIEKNPDLLNTPVRQVKEMMPVDKFTVEVDERAALRKAKNSQGYDYQVVLEMCESLLEANREKYFDIIFYNPEINAVKGELINWYLEKFDIRFEIDRIVKLPAYLIDGISKENIDRLIELARDVFSFSTEAGRSLLKVILKSSHLTENFINDNKELITSDNELLSLVAANPSISPDFKKVISEEAFWDYIKTPVYFYYSMSELDKKVLLNGSAPIKFFNACLATDDISFKNKFTGEPDWMIDEKKGESIDQKYHYCSINEKSFDEFVSLLSLRSVLMGNSMTYNRVDKYMSFDSIQNIHNILGTIVSCIQTKNYNFVPAMYKYINDIINGLAIIYSRSGKLDDLIEKLQFYKAVFDENQIDIKTLDEKSPFVDVYKFISLLDEKIKWLAQVKEKNQVLMSSTDKLYCNDYTIDDIDRLYVNEVLNNEKSVIL